MSAYANIIETLLGIGRRILPVFVTPSRRENFFAKANCMFMIADNDGKILDVNNCFAQSIGYERRDMVGQPFMRFVYPPDRQETIRTMSEIGMGSKIAGFRNRYVTKTGAVVTLEWTSVRNGDINATARIVTDG